MSCTYHCYFVYIDIDECQSFPPKCNENADCTDNNGSFTCDCKLGFSGDGFSCEREDKCLHNIPYIMYS